MVYPSLKTTGVQLTLITRDLNTPYSGMLPGTRKPSLPPSLPLSLPPSLQFTGLIHCYHYLSFSLPPCCPRTHRGALHERGLPHRPDPPGALCRGPLGPHGGEAGREGGREGEGAVLIYFVYQGLYCCRRQVSGVGPRQAEDAVCSIALPPSLPPSLPYSLSPSLPPPPPLFPLSIPPSLPPSLPGVWLRPRPAHGQLQRRSSPSPL